MENLSGTFIKGYELRERIGAGGFGAVYRAYQSTVGREVAIKIIIPHFANHPDFIRRFETEAQLVARLEHPYITPLYDYWRELDGAYLVMRWLKGGSLRDSLQHGPFDLQPATLLLEQIAAALSVAHRVGVIHRDIKPGNILLDEDGNAYLADFGIAKDTINLDGSHTEAEAIVGSPDYLSPEQARNELVTPATDIYSLGVTLYEMLMGQHPFPNLTPVERIFKHLNEPLPIISTLPIEVRDPVNAVIQKATAKNPAHRYTDVLEMATALRQAIGALAPQSNSSLVASFTLREQDILQLLIEGRSNKEIGQDLFITVQTVKWYIRQIYAKLGVRSRVQAIVRARELNLIGSRTNGQMGSTSSLQIDIVPENPYKGLRAFTAADHKDYFGREKLTDKLVKKLGETGDLSRFLAVVGPSGSGKSSLVKAGLIPAIWKGALPNSDKWFVVEMLPGAQPLDELEIALTKVAAQQAGNLHEHLTRDERGLSRVASLILPNDGSDLLLVIDQFEEVFTLVEDEQARQHFLRLIYNAVTVPRSRVRVVITLRADFYDRPLHYPEFGELMRSRVETVLPLSAEELERAIAKPAESVSVKFEPGLVAGIVADVNYQPGALPLLQYALTELFERREGHTLTREAYQAIGGTVGALAKRAEEIYLSLDEAGREAARQMLLRLVTLGEGTEDTRRRVARSELLAIADDTDVFDDLIDTYAEYRLLSLDTERSTRTPTVELAHEALLREWERLRAWLNESREDVRLQRQMLALSTEWHAAKQDASFLLRGSRLEQFEKWAGETQLALTEKERQFVDASLKQRTTEQADEENRQARELQLALEAAEHAQKAAASQKNAANRLRQLVVVLVLAVIGALALSGVAFNERQTAQTERDNLQVAQATLSANYQHLDNMRLALTANNFLLNNNGYEVEIATLLALHALHNGYLSEADQALQTLMQNGFPVHYFQHPNFATQGVAFSPDGHYVATGDGNGVLLLWDAQTAEQVRAFVGHTDEVIRLDFSSDGRLLASASADHTVRVWDVASGQQLLELDHNGLVASARFSSDGTRILSAGEDRMVHIWDIATGELQLEFRANDEFAEAVIFSPDGRYILGTGEPNGRIRLWDATTGEVIHEFLGHASYATSMDFNSDGSEFLSGSIDQTARLWDVATGETLREFTCDFPIFDLDISPDDHYAVILCGSFAQLWDLTTGELQHEYRVLNNPRQVRFSPDSQYFATSTESTFVYLWETHPLEYPRTFTTSNVTKDAAFSPDGHFIATASDGFGTEVVLWNYDTGEAVWRYGSGTSFSVNNVDFSPDGRYLAVDLSWFTVLLDVATGTEIRRFDSGQGGDVWGLDFSPDGRRLVTASFACCGAYSRPGVVVVWDVETGLQIWQAVGSDTDAIGAAYSPDGSMIVTGSHDHIARLWDAADGHEIRRFQHPDSAYMVEFSHDGRYVATAGWDSVARIWDVQTGEEVRQFIGHQNVIGGIAFSSDDRYLLTGSSDATVRLWDTATGALLRTYYSYGIVIGVSFSPDDQYVVAGSFNGGTRIWQRDLQPMVEFICSRLARDLNHLDRATFGVTDSDPTCPSNPNIIAQETSIQAVYMFGDFQRAVGCIGDVVADCEITRMQDSDGDGIYTLTLNNIPAGRWQLWVGLNGRRIEFYGVSGLLSSGVLLNIPVDSLSVTVTYNSLTHEITVTMPEATSTPVP